MTTVWSVGGAVVPLFGVAALIFLVTQELLLEANERQADASLPYINSWPAARTATRCGQGTTTFNEKEP